MTTIESLSAVAQCTLGATFILSALAKMQTSKTLPEAIRRFTFYRLNVAAARFAAILLPLVELMVAAGLVAGFNLELFALASMALLLVFNAFIIAHLARGSRLPCHCFGDGGTVIGGGTLMRNLLLMALALWLVFLAHSHSAAMFTLTRLLALPWHEILGILVTTMSMMIIIFALGESSALSGPTSSRGRT